MYYLAFNANFRFIPNLLPVNTVIPEYVNEKFVLEWATEYSFSEETIENGTKNAFFIEFSDNEMDSGEIKVLFSLRGINQTGIQTDPAYYAFSINIAEHNIGKSASINLADGVDLSIDVLSSGVFNSTLH
tara:strand:+ start:379 stop:768 length:390 start_codon:yes stop_codon:yes gene_type:complete